MVFTNLIIEIIVMPLCNLRMKDPPPHELIIISAYWWHVVTDWNVNSIKVFKLAWNLCNQIGRNAKRRYVLPVIECSSPTNMSIFVRSPAVGKFQLELPAHLNIDALNTHISILLHKINPCLKNTPRYYSSYCCYTQCVFRNRFPRPL